MAPRKTLKTPQQKKSEDTRRSSAVYDGDCASICAKLQPRSMHPCRSHNRPRLMDRQGMWLRPPFARSCSAQHAPGTIKIARLIDRQGMPAMAWL